MNCLHPVFIPNPRRALGPSPKGRASFYERFASSSPDSSYHPLRNPNSHLDDDLYTLCTSEEVIAVPCRRCSACLRSRAAEWRSRLVREAAYHQSLGHICHFVTLTYDNTTIDRALATYKHDMALFYDRLRSRFRRSIPHFSIGELGDKRGRFHVHVILFNSESDLDPDSHFHTLPCGSLHGSNRYLSLCWRRGIVDVGRLKDFKGCSYLCSYITKSAPNHRYRCSFFPIVASNGLGFHNITAEEIRSIKLCLSRFEIPRYTLFGHDYSYPSCVLRRYLSTYELSLLTFMSRRRDEFFGGKFRPLSVTFASPVFTSPFDLANYVGVLESCLPQSPVPCDPPFNPCLTSYPDVNVRQEYLDAIYIVPF